MEPSAVDMPRLVPPIVRFAETKVLFAESVTRDGFAEGSDDEAAALDAPLEVA